MKTGLPRDASVRIADPARCQAQSSDRSGIARCDHGYKGPLPRGVAAVNVSVSGEAGAQVLTVNVDMHNARYRPRLGHLIYDNPAQRLLLGVYTDYRKDATNAAGQGVRVALEQKLDASEDHRNWEVRIVDPRGNVLAGLPPLDKR